MKDAGVEEFTFNHYLRYENQLGEDENVQVFPFNRGVVLDDPGDYEEVWKMGGKMTREMLELDFTEEFDL